MVAHAQGINTEGGDMQEDIVEAQGIKPEGGDMKEDIVEAQGIKTEGGDMQENIVWVDLGCGLLHTAKKVRMACEGAETLQSIDSWGIALDGLMPGQDLRGMQWVFVRCDKMDPQDPTIESTLPGMHFIGTHDEGTYIAGVLVGGLTVSLHASLA